MDDLISRKAAIEAIRKLESGEDFNFNNGLICAINSVDELPSIPNFMKENEELKQYNKYLLEEKEKAMMQGEINGLRFAIRCNGVSGGNVG